MNPHRLPRTVLPTRYDLDLSVDLDGAAFAGTVGITLTVDQPVDRLVCHAVDLDIATVEVRSADGAAVAVTGWSVDPATERLTVETATAVPAGGAELSIGFSGILNDKLLGFYRSTFSDGDGERTMAVTQFEAPHARRAFPCWDEPEFKAVFSVTLEVDASLLAVSNGPELARDDLGDGRVRIRYGDTIAMSTYLVAWVIGPLEATAPVESRGVPIRVVHRPGQGHLTASALDIAAHSVAWFEDYYQIAYPAEKMDLVAVPDFAFGAMENLGCITFREILLLIDPARVDRAELERAVTVIDHEIAHMWFGDLVTMRWWNGIWLNEAFATFMELNCADDYRPEWEVWTSFGLSRTQAFDTDALASTRPIEYEVATPEDADGMFDILTYEKGASVLRMLEQYVGPDVFRDGIRRYLGAHQLANTETSDLWDALDAVTDVPVPTVMDSWIFQGGHPLIQVELIGDPGGSGASGGQRLRISQQRMSYAGGDPVPPTTYVTPIRLEAGGPGGRSRHRLLLDAEPVEIPLDGPIEWVNANLDATGFYRVDYSPKLRRALTARATELSAIERFALVDDTWAALLAGRAGIDDVVAVIRGLAADGDPSVWRRIASVLASLAAIEGGRDGAAAAALARELTDGRWSVGPFPEGGDDAELAGVLLRTAGVIGGEPTAVTAARGVLERSRAADSHEHPSLVTASIDVVATHGDDTRFEEFLDQYRRAETPQDELRALGALTMFGDPGLQQRLLELCRTEVRTQNAPYTLAQAMAHPTLGRHAWEFVRDHWDELVERFPTNSITRMAGGVRAIYDPSTVDDVLAFFADHDVPVGQQTLRQHLERVRVNAALRARVGDEITALATSG